MSDDNGVLSFEPTEQLVGSIYGVCRGLPFDQNVRRAPDRAAFPAVKDIAITTHAGIARPFVTRKANEPPGNVELRRKPVELLPELIGNLEIITLLPDHVDERRVTRLAEIGFRCTHPDCFTALAV